MPDNSQVLTVLENEIQKIIQGFIKVITIEGKSMTETTPPPVIIQFVKLILEPTYLKAKDQINKLMLSRGNEYIESELKTVEIITPSVNISHLRNRMGMELELQIVRALEPLRKYFKQMREAFYSLDLPEPSEKPEKP